ncbi:Galactofuranosyltransferase GlfT1 [Meiothermus luteus]|jgi:GT2 family glycosyltransferase|uniref:Galactofuranosyltransferase GlfT1 n=1 Tax=Meiothermus luteus TaxID=2026184 RepID=A0A399EFR6_9DEIN|nr:glycosyltransferase family 2 protein [Meiothermus luteus]RIH82798.1 Galactofuranosyltransferase GlfT1 [Meiothermus luteus]RMH58399.1 MAG: glycosyltransferase [Deinococcota bacterium]
MSPTILALVVTHNRKNLLKECLNCLLGQNHPVDRILVIDNASTDGTQGMVAQQFPQVEYVRLSENLGAAGGFHHGLAIARELDYDWIWLLDDDAHPKPDSLQKLVNGLERALCLGKTPDLLLSHLVWLDGRTHPMGIPWPDLRRPLLLLRAWKHRLVPIRFGTYASMLVSQVAARKYPLPTKEYFLWNDDLEYSGRILRRGLGFLVKDSLVVHKTRNPFSSAISSTDEQFYLEARNRAWLVRSDAFGPLGKAFWVLNSLGVFLARLRVRGWRGIHIIAKGWLEGFRNPPPANH